ncbi:unnamed protein product [Brugia timori]|nr:unnamed protein product [Brugia timori]
MEKIRMKRPNANDTEEDLFRMQKEMLNRKCKGQVHINNNSFAANNWQIDKPAGRFCLDLDCLDEEKASIMELTERNVELFHKIDQLDDCSNLINCAQYAEEEGFPDILDLSR